MTTTTTRTATECKIHWDSQDPGNEGWAYRVHFDDGHEESGPWDYDLPLRDAVVELADQHGVEITGDDVIAEPNIDGGYAFWRADA